jgi:hypothetical protein
MFIVAGLRGEIKEKMIGSRLRGSKLLEGDNRKEGINRVRRMEGRQR